MYIVYCILYIVYCILYILYCILYILYSIFLLLIFYLASIQIGRVSDLHGLSLGNLTTTSVSWYHPTSSPNTLLFILAEDSDCMTSPPVLSSQLPEVVCKRMARYHLEARIMEDGYRAYVSQMDVPQGEEKNGKSSYRYRCRYRLDIDIDIDIDIDRDLVLIPPICSICSLCIYRLSH